MSGLRMTSLACVVVLLSSSVAGAQPRARDLRIPFDGTAGKLNAITDVAGVEVGHETLVSGKGKLKVGTGPVRTGVTAILPRGKTSTDPVFAGWFSLNGNGEMTGTTWIEESGFLEGPVMLTNTNSVGVVRDAVVAWYRRMDKGSELLPVVAETHDGYLNDIHGFHVKEKHALAALDSAKGGAVNDIHGFHVKEKHALAALDSAKGGAVAEGNVGGGTGMRCFDFAGGIGTSSRVVSPLTPLPSPPGRGERGYTVGVLVQANFGLRRQLRIAGIPVGEKLTAEAAPERREAGSIIIVIATDAPLLPHQLKRLARRASLGLARTGSIAGNGSGDIFVAFSTANAGAAKPRGTVKVTFLPNERMDALFEATVQATEEAIINALVAAKTMIGRDNHKAEALPLDRVVDILKKHNRLVETSDSK